MSFANILVPNNYSLFIDQALSSEVAAAATTAPTGANVAGGLITVTTAGGAVSMQIPTAAALVAAVPNAEVGSVIKCLVVAYGHASNAVTATTNTGITLLGVGELTIPARTSRLIYFRFTNVTASSEAVSVY